MSAKTVKDHQFLEVDQDLRLIAEREAAKPLCQFGQRCYRKNPDHFREYRHLKADSELQSDQNKTKDDSGLKKNKITDFFKRKPPPKNISIGIPGKDDDYRIDDSDEEVKIRDNSKDSLEPNLKRKRHSSNENIKDDSSKSPNPSGNADRSNRITNCPTLTDDQKKPESAIEANQSHSLNEESIINTKMTSNELNKVFKEVFLVEMPKDFYQFWQFCKNIKPDKPEDALVEALGLKLVGPFDVLAGKVKKQSMSDKQKILCHWRYFYDLPEMQTIISSLRSGHHLAYFRDTPEEENPVIVSNNGDNCLIEGIADNIFSAIICEIQRSKSKVTANASLKSLEAKLKEFSSQNKIELTAKTKLKARKSKVIAKTFNGFGFVVPFNKKTEVGYRPLPVEDSQLKKLVNTIIKTDPQFREDSNSLNELKDIFQLISYANDECDFGMGLELGIDLFCSGDPFFNKSVQHLLSMAYTLLERKAFALIISEHMNNRRTGNQLDAL